MRRRRLLILIAVAAVAGAAGVLLRSGDALRSLEQDSYDLRMSVRGHQSAPGDIVIVAIDEPSFGELGVRWPIPRSRYGRLLDRLHAAGAKLVALDLQFTERSDDDEDFALYTAVKRNRPVVLATTAADARGRTAVLGGDANVRAAGAVVGMSIFPVDSDGVIRRLPWSVRRVRSFSLRTADLARGRRVEGRGLPPEGAWIDFRGPPGTFRTIPFWRALRERSALAGVRGKIVIVGASAPSLQDLHATAAPGPRLMSGAELQANALATALDGFPLRDAGRTVDTLLIVLMAAFAPLAATRLRERWALVAGVAALAAFVVGAQLAFAAGRVVTVVYPVIAGVIGVAGSVGVAYFEEHVERDRLRRLFADFQPEIVEAVLAADPERSDAVGLERDQIIAGFRIERLVGRGGMGVVYEATQLMLGRRVALKLIRPAVARDERVRERFKQESRLAAAVEHPNVIPLYEAGEDGDILFIAMRFIPGTDLAALIAEEGPLGPRRATRIVRQVAAALDAAHAAGLVHRDVKPSNVLVAEEGPHEHAYLTDFGVTRVVDGPADLTSPGRMVGTLDYMAPEQIRGRRVDGAADVYALGCLLYRTLTGRVPFHGESDAETMLMHLDAEPPRMPDRALSAFDPVIARALAKRPEDRFASAGELAAAAHAAAEQAPPDEVRPPQGAADRDEPPLTSEPTQPA
jgi:CHASE2 domain-containing sensor protein